MGPLADIAAKEPRQKKRKTTDDFDELWGSQTKWKTSSFQHHSGQSSKQLSPHHNKVSYDLRSTKMVNSSPQELSSALNKPLPPLPSDKIHVRANSKRRARDSVSSSGSLPKIFKSSVLSINNVLRGLRRSTTLPASGGANRGRNNSKLPMVSKATQTSPRMLKLHQKSIMSTSVGALYQANTDVHPGNRIPTPNTSTPSLLRRLLSKSSLSPQSRADTGDYFQTKTRGRDSSPSSSRTADSMSLDSRDQERSRALRSLDESKFTSLVSTRKFASDPSPETEITPWEGIPSFMPISSMPISQLQRLQARGYRGSAGKSAPLGRLFRKKSSPLQQEIKRTPIDLPKRLPRSETMNLWSRGLSTPDSGTAHLQLYKPSSTPGIDTDVPDHLSGSPLCPLHLQNKSFGQAACPQHGRLQDEDLKDTQAEDLNRSLDVLTPGSIDSMELDRPFILNVPDHLPNSPLCPANLRYQPDGKGVCVLHGRLQLSRDGDSEDHAKANQEHQLLADPSFWKE